MGRELICADVCADGVGAREWMEMGGEKGPVGMSEPGCADCVKTSLCKSFFPNA